MIKKPMHKGTSKTSEKKLQKRYILMSLFFVFVVAGAATLYLFVFHANKKPAVSQNAEIILNQSVSQDVAKKGTVKVFTGQQFRDLYNNFAYPNTEYIADDAVITGDETTDAHIQKLAEARGYARRSAPVSDAFKTVEDGLQLQERASQPWIDLKNAAKKDGIGLFLTAAYRSAKDQRELFMTSLHEAGIPVSSITSGAYDNQINTILGRTAIPGYSRHHTGYTIDIGCQNDRSSIFDATICFKWLSQDNYRNTKLYGWIPSYPDGAGKQGPNPESWEYVWVGTDATTE